MLINVILGGETRYMPNGVPYVVGGSPSQMNTDALERREPVFENEIEKTVATEYWLGGQLVHRSVHVHLKTGIFAEGIQANF
jgi:hypothetical protein